MFLLQFLQFFSLNSFNFSFITLHTFLKKH
nr:MAG TPA: hypothetical protein [Caudoviricetes sp.]